MKRLFSRLVSPTPPFFRKLRNAGVFFTGLSGGLMAIPSIQDTHLYRVLPYLAVIGFTASFTSQLTKEKSNESKRKKEAKKGS